MFTPMAATMAAALPVLLVWAGALDVLTRSIPNLVVILLIACFAAFATANGLTVTQVLMHILCASAILACGFGLFTYSLLGGGDAKLLAGAALWFGFENILPFLASVALAGGALSLSFLAADAMGKQFGVAYRQSRSVPFGAAIAVGALVVVPDWLAAV